MRSLGTRTGIPSHFPDDMEGLVLSQPVPVHELARHGKYTLRAKNGVLHEAVLRRADLVGDVAHCQFKLADDDALVFVDVGVDEETKRVLAKNRLALIDIQAEELHAPSGAFELFDFFSLKITECDAFIESQYTAFKPRWKKFLEVTRVNGEKPSTADDFRKLQVFLERRKLFDASLAGKDVKHDNVAVIHHVGQEGDVPYLVMEMLEGETLDERLKRLGRLPVSEIPRLGESIAFAGKR